MHTLIAYLPDEPARDVGAAGRLGRMPSPASAGGLVPAAGRLYERQPMQDSAPAAQDPRRRRLLYRATHRGTFENDLMFGGFVRAHLADFDDAALTALEALLEIPDNDLADWLTGRRPIPPEAVTPMLLRIKDSLPR